MSKEQKSGVLFDWINEIELRQAKIAENQEDIKLILSTAKAVGYNVQALKEVLKRRKKGRETVDAVDSAIHNIEQELSFV